MAGPALRALVATKPARDSDVRSRWWWLALAPLLLPVGVALLVLVLLAGSVEQGCRAGVFPVDPGGEGSLGGIAGTGLTREQIRAVRTGSPYANDRVVPGRYEATSYGPPWGGIQGSGQATSGGLVIAGGSPRWYMIAVDPLLVGHGRLVYIWPNPFRWRGPFLAADTGGAIHSRRIDFYDWRGRATQLGWARRNVHVSARPIAGPQPVSAVGCATPVSSKVGSAIGRLARAQLGRGPQIPEFEPPAVSYAWCAWFAINVWRQAGIPIPFSAWSGYAYDWAAARGQLFKAVGARPIGPTPPVGSALMYGTDSRPPNGSEHINLIDRVLPDGSFMVTGGNQDGSRVTRYGPCRLRRSDPAFLDGPGCDPRPIYGVATPTERAAT